MEGFLILGSGGDLVPYVTILIRRLNFEVAGNSLAHPDPSARQTRREKQTALNIYQLSTT